MTPAGSLPREISRLQRPALLAGAGGIILLLIALILPGLREQCFRGYLVGWLFFFGISAGSLALVMLGHLVNGEWAWLIRRLGEAAALNLVLLAVLFIPLLFGLGYLYPWASPALVRADAILHHKSIYLNPMWFTIRAAIYFIIWIGLAAKMRRESIAHDLEGTDDSLMRARAFAAPGLLAFMITMTLASVDWIMSRDAHWFSTVMGFAFVVGQACTAMAFLVWMLMRVAGRDPIAPVIEKRHLNDLGNLLLTLVILWAYLSFAQFLVIWMGNAREDNSWFVERGFNPNSVNGWRWLALFLIVFHFFVPFFILLSRDNKRRIEFLKKVALWLLVVRALDIVWQVVPTAVDPHAGPKRFTLLVLPGLLAVGGIWFATFVRILSKQPLLPKYSPLEVNSSDNVHAVQTNGAGHAAPGAT